MLVSEELISLFAERDVRIAAQDAQICALSRQVADLLEANEQLRVALARLEHLRTRNSRNSSMPPSQDDDPGRIPPAEKPNSPGMGSKRKKGKQPGAPGTNLAFTDNPTKRVDRFPQGRCACGHELSEAADLGVVDRYQQHEIPQISVTVTQYDQHQVRCGCGRIHTAARPEGARAGAVGYAPGVAGVRVYLMVMHHLPAHRCVALLESLTGAAPSVGFVHSMLERTAGLLAEVDKQIAALITMAYVVCCDETPIRVGPRTPKPGKKKADKYLLVACTRTGLPDYTRYLPSRGMVRSR